MAEQEREKKEKSYLWKKREERKKRLREQKALKRVRVVPRDGEIRRDIKHPVSRLAFPAEGSVEWPLDAFTKRRIIDGTVSLAEDQQRDRQENHRQRRRHDEPPSRQES